MLQTNEGMAGLVFDLNNWEIPVENLAKLIGTIANDSSYYGRLVDCVNSAAQKFDPNRMVEDYERIYFDLVEEGKFKSPQLPTPL